MKTRALFLVVLALVCVSVTAQPVYFDLGLPTSESIESEKMSFKTQTVVTGLDVPWSMAFLPNGSMLITERAGRLRIVENGVLREEPIKNVPEVYAKGQGGLLDVVLHPDYEKNGWIYISHSYATGMVGGHTKIIRAKLKDYTLTNIETIFEGGPGTVTRVHFGGRMVLTEGKLFFSIGERGEMKNAQNLENHSGKIFRINDDGSVPKDNPFVNTKGAKPEIWTYGNRNPQGLALNPFTNELWAHEHGPKGGDEVNIIKKGNNYGWPLITYGINYNGEIISEDTAKAGLTQPIHYWNPSIAPSGLAFLKSDKYPAWNGNAMVGALAFASLYRCEITKDDVVHVERLLAGDGRIRDVRLAPDGYVYIANETNGTIIRILPN
ncbi:PQQ-dependent sugar dehydrogenase [bacterium]|nr:MAG: PQQ-dependent sugar dehydrogenase [bacterium]